MHEPLEGKPSPKSTFRRGAIGLATAGGTWYAAFVIASGFRWHERSWWTLFDDAMVSMRYARHLAEGHGLVWNVGGTPVEGYTNLLWTLWMAVLHLLPLPRRLMPLIVGLCGAALLVVLVLAVHRLGRRLEPRSPTVAWLAAGLVAGAWPLLFWTLRGMEVGALALLLVLAADQALGGRRRAPLALAVVLVLGAALRPDALAPLGVVIAWFLWQSSQRPVRDGLALAATAALALLALTTWRLAYYGLPVPNTAYLKLGVALPLRLERGARTLLPELGRLWPLWVPALAGLIRPRIRRPPQLLLLGPFAVLVLYHLYVGGDAWEEADQANRYLSAGLPLLVLAAARGAVQIVTDSGRRLREVTPQLHRVAPLVARLAVLALAGALAFLGFLDIGQPWLGGGRGAFAVALLVLAGFLAVAALQRRTDLPVAALALAVWIPLLWGSRFQEAWADQAFNVREDRVEVVRGLRLLEGTDPEARIAFVWAGTAAYYSDRPAIDLLGKCDPRIARTAPVTAFVPGHDRWDLTLSLADHPDVVVDVPRPRGGGGVRRSDLDVMNEASYSRLASGLWVSSSSTHVDRAQLARRFPTWWELASAETSR